MSLGLVHTNLAETFVGIILILLTLFGNFKSSADFTSYNIVSPTSANCISLTFTAEAPSGITKPVITLPPPFIFFEILYELPKSSKKGKLFPLLSIILILVLL